MVDEEANVDEVSLIELRLILDVVRVVDRDPVAL